MSKFVSCYLSQIKEFAAFEPSEQRYIQRSIAIAEGQGQEPVSWARDGDEKRSVAHQQRIYRGLTELRARIPSDKLAYIPRGYLGKLIEIMAFDLQQGGLKSFSATRFLYERLLGVEARPWLPSAFCAAAALPQIIPERRAHLLNNIREAVIMAPGWAMTDNFFTPEWVVADEQAATQKQALRKRFNQAQISWRPRIERAKKPAVSEVARLFMDDAKKFITFSKRDQRFIKSSLEVASMSPDVFTHWARDVSEARMLSSQKEKYGILPSLAIQLSEAKLTAVDADFMDKAIGVAAFDLAQERLSGFPAFHFLYERLLGPYARPWLPSLYLGAVMMPQVPLALRRGLVPTIVVNDAAVSAYGPPRKPAFQPRWVAKETAPSD